MYSIHNGSRVWLVVCGICMSSFAFFVSLCRTKDDFLTNLCWIKNKNMQLSPKVSQEVARRDFFSIMIVGEIQVEKSCSTLMDVCSDVIKPGRFNTETCHSTFDFVKIVFVELT